MTCPENAVAASATLCQCNAVALHDDTATLTLCLMQGFFLRGQGFGSPAQACIACKTGFSCPKGTTEATLAAAAGYYKPSNTSLVYGPCQPNGLCFSKLSSDVFVACLGGTSGNCSMNREGLLCADCVPGAAEWGGQCVQCGSSDGGFLFLFLLLSWTYARTLHVTLTYL